MMNFFRRESKKTTTTTTPTPSVRTKSRLDTFDPIPVAEVEESTWNEWEDSVAFHNSQTDQAQDSTDGNAPAPATNQSEPASDPFASITKNRA